MCGFVGVASGLELTTHDIELLKEATASIHHRGPDGSGVFTDKRLALGHTRLSILDLSEAGSQPMVSQCGRFVISYNGEVYNYIELAKEFGLNDLNSNSDTEVILELFAKEGEQVFASLNGMFAFALLDRIQQKLWLVRDRLGIKPLYIKQDNDKIVFGSEIKAIKALAAPLTRVNESALGEWVYYGTTLGRKTLLHGVERLLPGHFMRVDLSDLSVETKCYWRPPLKPIGIEGDIIKQSRELLEQAVRRQLVSDVPIGVFLSGGIDSSAITAFATKHYSGTLATYSAGFDFDKGVNELPQARKLAKLYGTEHYEIQISGLDVADTVQRLVHHHDQPFSDAANIPLYLLCKEIKDETKVVLQGDGGDELFGGYKRYATLSRLSRMKAVARIGKFVNFFSRRNAAYYSRERYINALLAQPRSKLMALLLTVEDEKQDPAQIFHPKLRSRFSDPFQRYKDVSLLCQGRSPADQMLLVDSMIILPDIFLEKVDRSTMAASVEVRVPFLDNDLVEFCHQLSADQKIPNGKLKHLLKESLSGIVPDEVLYGKKTGFGVPFGYWLKGPLKELFFDNLAAFNSLNPDVIDSTYVRQRYYQHLIGQRDNGFLLWKLLNLLVWSNQRQVNWEQIA